MSKVSWMQIVVFSVVALLVFMIGASLLGASYQPWGMMGPGMMGVRSFGSIGWMSMAFMWVFPLGGLALVVLGIVWLVKGGTQPGGQTPAVPGRACPNCARETQVEWQLCPYCGQALR